MHKVYTIHKAQILMVKTSLKGITRTPKITGSPNYELKTTNNGLEFKSVTFQG